MEADSAALFDGGWSSSCASVLSGPAAASAPLSVAMSLQSLTAKLALVDSRRSRGVCTSTEASAAVGALAFAIGPSLAALRQRLARCDRLRQHVGLAHTDQVPVSGRR